MAREGRRLTLLVTFNVPGLLSITYCPIAEGRSGRGLGPVGGVSDPASARFHQRTPYTSSVSLTFLTSEIKVSVPSHGITSKVNACQIFALYQAHK